MERRQQRQAPSLCEEHRERAYWIASLKGKGKYSIFCAVWWAGVLESFHSEMRQNPFLATLLLPVHLLARLLAHFLAIRSCTYFFFILLASFSASQSNPSLTPSPVVALQA